MGYADLLAAETTGPLNPKQRRFVEMLRDGSLKLLEIMDGKKTRSCELGRQER
jgi:hypothetical protein